MTADVTQPGEALVVQPVTGEALDLATAPTDSIAKHIEQVREIEVVLRSFKRALADEVLRRMDHDSTYSAHLPGGLVISGDGPRGPERVGEQLYKELHVLVAEGVISERARLAAVEPVTEYKVKAKGVTALLKRDDDPRIAEAIERASRPNPKPRGVRVTREV